jgi:hypothetical protein
MSNERTMQRGWWSGRSWASLTLAGLLLAAPGSSWAEVELPQEEVERIVREYLLREPEIIMQAIEELQRRREAQAAVDQRERLAGERRRWWPMRAIRCSATRTAT